MTAIAIKEIEVKVWEKGRSKGKTYLRIHATPGGWGSIIGEEDVLFVQRKGSGQYDAVIAKNEAGFTDYSVLRLPSEDLMAEGLRKAEERQDAADDATEAREYRRSVERPDRTRESIERQKAADIAKDLAIAEHGMLLGRTSDLTALFEVYFGQVLAAIQGNQSLGAESGNASGETIGVPLLQQPPTSAGQEQDERARGSASESTSDKRDIGSPAPVAGQRFRNFGEFYTACAAPSLGLTKTQVHSILGRPPRPEAFEADFELVWAGKGPDAR